MLFWARHSKGRIWNRLPVPVRSSLLDRGGGRGGTWGREVRREQQSGDGGHSHLLAAQDSLSQTTQQTWAKRSVPSTLAELPTGILAGQKESRKDLGWTEGPVGSRC